MMNRQYQLMCSFSVVGVEFRNYANAVVVIDLSPAYSDSIPPSSHSFPLMPPTVHYSSIALLCAHFGKFNQ